MQSQNEAVTHEFFNWLHQFILVFIDNVLAYIKIVFEVEVSEMPAKLSVNLNAVALLRNRRDLPWPDVVGLGRIALNAGAHGLTVHPRPDQRHIRFSDLAPLRALIDDEFPDAELNIEGYPTGEFLELVEKHEPDQVTLVPDDPSQATSDHGWDFISNHNVLVPIITRLKTKQFRVSCFCDPDADETQIIAASEAGSDRIELYTGPYGSTFDDSDAAENALADLSHTAGFAAKYGMDVNAGHDLTVANMPGLAGAVDNLLEVSIGNGLIADALEFGMEGTVKRFLSASGWPTT
jgi:pyridoxine 5-phosphate synthase